MKLVIKEEVVTTNQRLEVVDITGLVERIVAESGINSGFCLVHLPHATAGLVANENEAGLIRDLLNLISEIFKPGHSWMHNKIDNNAHAHLAVSFIGSTRVFPVKNRRLVRGTWQHILLVELDGPRTRRVVVEVMGE